MKVDGGLILHWKITGFFRWRTFFFGCYVISKIDDSVTGISNAMR